jgi:hypothetical protein
VSGTARPFGVFMFDHYAFWGSSKKDKWERAMGRIFSFDDEVAFLALQLSEVM